MRNRRGRKGTEGHITQSTERNTATPCITQRPLGAYAAASAARAPAWPRSHAISRAAARCRATEIFWAWKAIHERADHVVSSYWSMGEGVRHYPYAEFRAGSPQISFFNFAKVSQNLRVILRKFRGIFAKFPNEISRNRFAPKVSRNFREI